MKSYLNTGLAVGAMFALCMLPVATQNNPLREAYFGETHVHTSWSFDAYVFGNTKTGPEDAYKFAMGEPIEHPAGYQVKITRPLDFFAVTDHAEYAGTVRLANDPDSALSKLPIADKLKVKEKDDIMRIYLFLGASLLKNKPIQELNSPEVAGSVWKQVVAIADKYYRPGKFTTFAAYEWTSTPQNRNMHRNVIFEDHFTAEAISFIKQFPIRIKRSPIRRVESLSSIEVVMNGGRLLASASLRGRELAAKPDLDPTLQDGRPRRLT